MWQFHNTHQKTELQIMTRMGRQRKQGYSLWTISTWMGIAEKTIIEQKQPSQHLAFNNPNMQPSICRLQLTDL